MISREEWEELMLENNKYWDIDISVKWKKEKTEELKELKRSIWSRVWNWRKISKIEKQLRGENQNTK